MLLMQKVMIKKLRHFKQHLTPQQYKTIKGQILSGDTEGASKGLNKLIERMEKGGEMNGEERN